MPACPPCLSGARLIDISGLVCDGKATDHLLLERKYNSVALQPHALMPLGPVPCLLSSLSLLHHPLFLRATASSLNDCLVRNARRRFACQALSYGKSSNLDRRHR